MLLPEDWAQLPLEFIATLAPLQELRLAAAESAGVRLLIKREDLLHPLFGGNKLYKLHGHLQAYYARCDGKAIATFGGAYSNHLIALACVGNMLNIPTVGIVRGECPPVVSPTLRDARAMGMQLHFVSRSDYRKRTDPAWLKVLEKELGECYWVPEGGGGIEGAAGGVALARGILALSDEPPAYVFHACGTGTSLAGLAAGFSRAGQPEVAVRGVATLKAAESQRKTVKEILQEMAVESQNWRIIEGYEAGGYAKFPGYLAQFLGQVERDTQVPFDPVYTAKVMWAVVSLLELSCIDRGSTVVVVHSGGLQGRRGFGLEFNSE